MVGKIFALVCLCLALLGCKDDGQIAIVTSENKNYKEGLERLTTAAWNRYDDAVRPVILGARFRSGHPDVPQGTVSGTVNGEALVLFPAEVEALKKADVDLEAVYYVFDEYHEVKARCPLGRFLGLKNEKYCEVSSKERGVRRLTPTFVAQDTTKETAFGTY